jgi:hypothetical protein
VSIRPLRELIEFAAPSKVERLPSGAIVLRRVKYLGAKSANVNPDGTQNAYTLEARKKSERLYDGAKLFADHPEREKPNRERGLKEQLGRLRGPFAHEADGSYADAYLNPKHPLAESIAWSAEHSPDDLGLSHNAQGRGRVQGGDCLIEEITRVRSVDFVCAAATTRGLYESRTEDDMLLTKERLAELRETAAGKAKLTPAQKALVEALDEAALLAILADGAMAPEEKVMQALAMLASKGEKPAEGGEEKPATESKKDESPAGQPAGDAKLVESLQVKLAALEARLAAEETQKRRDALLAESKLPATDGLRALVRGAESDDRAKALLEEVKRAAFHQTPTSGGRATGAPAAGGQIKSVDDFVGALR